MKFLFQSRRYLFFETRIIIWKHKSLPPLKFIYVRIRKSSIISDNHDNATLQTFSLPFLLKIKLYSSKKKKDKTFQASLLSKNPDRGSVRFQFNVRQTRCARTYYLIQSTRPARHSIPFGVDRNSVTRNAGEKRRIARNAWPRRRGHDRVIAP